MKHITDDISITQSRFWQTNSGVIVRDDRAILIDAGVFPDEMARLAKQVCDQSIVAGLSTHEDWDHVLWSHDLGSDVPRYGNPVASRIVAKRREGLLRQIATEERTYNVRWDHNLIGRLQLVEFGSLTIAGFPFELHHLPGHTEGNAGYWVPRSNVAFVGDTLSDIDPPVVSADQAVAMQYPQTLDRLRNLITPLDVIVPGHGAVCDRTEALRRLELDARYLDVVFNATIDNTSGDPPSVIADRTSATLDDSRLHTDYGWEVHVQNVTDLLGGDESVRERLL